MRTVINQIVLAALLSISAPAQKINLFSALSPKLRQFLTDHPSAGTTMSGLLSEAFPGRRVQVLYYYADDRTAATTYHYYPTESSAVIVVREDQPASDECISLIFEMLNSAGEKRLLELANQAKSGPLSKADFVRGMMQEQFQAAKRMRDILGDLKLSKKEMTKSGYYSRFIQCPNDFAAFLSYVERVSPGQERLTQEFYERQYDSLRGLQ